MSDDTTKPGLPTVEQVRDHEKHGGLWRCILGGVAPRFAWMRHDSWTGIQVRWVVHDPQNQEEEDWDETQVNGYFSCCRWIPCDQQGSGLPLVEELDWIRVAVAREQERAAAIARAEAAERERDQSRKANEHLAERVRALQQRLVGLGSDLKRSRNYSRHMGDSLRERVAEYEAMLGDPGTPAGQALRALVRGARGEMNEASLTMSTEWVMFWLRDAISKGRWRMVALHVAILLIRIPVTPVASPEDITEPPDKRHVVNESGYCVEWCAACRENIASGRNPDGMAPAHDGLADVHAASLLVPAPRTVPADRGCEACRARPRMLSSQCPESLPAVPK